MHQDEPYWSIESHDNENFTKWMERGEATHLDRANKLNLFRVACNSVNIFAAKRILAEIANPTWPELVEIADDASRGEIVVLVIDANPLPGSVVSKEKLQEYTRVFVEKFKRTKGENEIKGDGVIHDERD